MSKAYKPGHHRDRRGGGAEYGDGGGVGGVVGRGRGVFSPLPLKTKPNEVSGGLKARILLWEMKTQKSGDEKCTEYNTAPGPGPDFSDRQETEPS